MNAEIKKLGSDNITDLVELSLVDNFPYKLTKELAAVYCRNDSPAEPGVRVYGNKLVGVMTATFCLAFPCDDSPSGRIVHLSGAFTLPEYRNRHFAAGLINLIQSDAVCFGADYLCCDSTADGFYSKFGFVYAPAGETRMWKEINK